MAVITRHRAGYTLVELVISLLVMSVVLVAALQTLGASVRFRRMQTGRDIAIALAHDLASEIAQAHYFDPEAEEADLPTTFGSEPDEPGGAGRTHFDDLDDYHGWYASPPESKLGTVVPDTAGIARAVSVEFVDVDDPGGPAVPSDTGLRRITVTVTGPGSSAQETILRGRYTSADQAPAGHASFVRWVGVTIDLGDGRPLTTGATIMNQVPLEDGS